MLPELEMTCDKKRTCTFYRAIRTGSAWGERQRENARTACAKPGMDRTVLVVDATGKRRRSCRPPDATAGSRPFGCESSGSSEAMAAALGSTGCCRRRRRSNLTLRGCSNRSGARACLERTWLCRPQRVDPARRCCQAVRSQCRASGRLCPGELGDADDGGRCCMFRGRYPSAAGSERAWGATAQRSRREHTVPVGGFAAAGVRRQGLQSESLSGDQPPAACPCLMATGSERVDRIQSGTTRRALSSHACSSLPASGVPCTANCAAPPSRGERADQRREKPRAHLGGRAAVYDFDALCSADGAELSAVGAPSPVVTDEHRGSASANGHASAVACVSSGGPGIDPCPARQQVLRPGRARSAFLDSTEVPLGVAVQVVQDDCQGERAMRHGYDASDSTNRTAIRPSRVRHLSGRNVT
jgi:hypothetical protein